MDMYDVIKKYENYFHSVRLHDSIVLLDLKLPAKWEVKNLLTNFNTTTQLKVNDQTDAHVLISFYSPYSPNEIKTLINDVDRIVKWNNDREEKNNLLNVKILELKKVFESNNVDSLRNINFDFKEEINVDLNGEELKLAEEGNREG
jgi:hypothetical protein